MILWSGADTGAGILRHPRTSAVGGSSSRTCTAQLFQCASVCRLSVSVCLCVCLSVLVSVPLSVCLSVCRARALSHSRSLALSLSRSLALSLVIHTNIDRSLHGKFLAGSALPCERINISSSVNEWFISAQIRSSADFADRSHG